MMHSSAYVCIMTNKPMGILYIGVTNEIAARVFAHRNGTGSEFCKKWDLKRLVYAEPFERIDEAIVREKAMKKWKRAWKLRLVSEANPNWDDLFNDINGRSWLPTAPAFAGATNDFP